MLDLHKDFIGLAAGALTTSSFLPQIIKIIRTKRARDVSLSMYLVFTTGVLLWFTYGLLLGRLPMIIFNSITITFCLVIITIKVRYRNNQ